MEHIHGLELQDNFALNDEVQPVGIDGGPFLFYRNGHFARYGYASLVHFSQ